MEKTHCLYFDYLRIFAMLSVLFMHSTSAVLWIDTVGIGGNWLLVNCLTSLAFSAVPLFFMMSGFLLFSSPKTADVSYLLKKRVPKLAVPLIFWSALSAAWLVFSRAGSGDPKDFLSLFATVGSAPIMIPFWFIYTLIALYLISPFLYDGLNRLRSGGRLYLLILLALVLVLTTIPPLLPEEARQYVPYRIFSELSLFGGHIVSFLLGWLLGRLERKIPNWILIVTAAVDFIVIADRTYFLTVENAFYTQTYQDQSKGFEILLAACIFLLFKQNLDRPFGRLNKLLSPLVALTFPIYLMHSAAINAAEQFHIARDTAAQVVVFTIVLTLVCYLTVKTLATVKPLCYAATGLSYQSACRSCNWIYTVRQLKGRLARRAENDTRS